MSINQLSCPRRHCAAEENQSLVNMGHSQHSLQREDEPLQIRILGKVILEPSSRQGTLPPTPNAPTMGAFVIEPSLHNLGQSHTALR